MKITLSAIALLVLFSAKLFAQTPWSIKGSAVDTVEKKELSNATIIVINAKDSILRKFTRAKADGSFAIDNLGKGKFIMLVSYPGYADYSEGFTLDESVQLSHDFGKIKMLLKARLLKDVIIKGEAIAMKIKGDTTEYNAKAYVIQPNDKVEDLLKQLPGIQVDKDGKITAQGAAVPKVLVDGEEFFGDDPTLVTKNIRADMVDKIQLYDKKSDQATFTGVDDGKTQKTINIKLKEDSKSGYFGKADGGIATNQYYQDQLLFNKFKGKEKFSLYGTIANTGKTGLNWDDNQKYGDGGNMQVMDNGDMYSTNSNDLSYNGQGLPVAKTGGMHYDNKWNNNKLSLNTNYKAGYLEINGSKNTLTQNNLPDSVINSSSDQTFHNSVFRQKLDATVQITLDTTSNLKIIADGAYKRNKSNTDNITQSDLSYIGNDFLLNRSKSSVTSDADQHIYDASTFYTKKLKKQGRTISALFSLAVNDNDSKGYSKSTTQFYDKTGAIDSTLIINQYKTGVTRNAIFNSNITYTEPLSKYTSLVFNYGANINNSNSDQKSFNQSASGEYDILDPNYSNNFKFNQLANQVGAIFNYNQKKVLINVGTRASDVTYKQVDGYTGDILKRNFINWNPQATFQYKFSQSRSFRFGYNGNTTQPSITQIQPVKNNNDPLYLVLGNPDLKPSFTNTFRINYNTYKVLSGQNLYVGANYSFITDPIVSNTSTDASGKTTSKYFNLNDRTPYNYNVYSTLGGKIKGPDINISINANVNGNVNYNMVNNVLNTTNLSSYSVGLNVNKYMANKYNFFFYFGPRYSINESSLQKNINSNGRGFGGYSYINYYLPAKFQISTDVDYSYTGATPTFNQDIYKTIWNVTLSKSFLKQNGLKFSATINDLLNQNIGFNRTATGSMITQNTFTTIRRYTMFSVTWDFTKMGAGATPDKK